MRHRQSKLTQFFVVVIVILLCIGLLLPYFMSIFSY